MTKRLYQYYRMDVGGVPPVNKSNSDPGWNPNSGWSQGIGSAATLGAGIIDASANLNDVGYPTMGATIGKDALSGAAAGAMFGPWGALIGGVVGAGAGVIQGGANKRKTERAHSQMRNTIATNNASLSASRLAMDPSLVQGDKNIQSYFKKGGRMYDQYYYAMGGEMESPLSKAYMEGGYGKSLSSHSVEMKGATHAQGGISIPHLGVNLEDGETTQDSFVFSKELGFAQQHKPLAIAVGRIEKKPQTRERIAATTLLNKKIGELRMAQEYLKQLKGIPS